VRLVHSRIRDQVEAAAMTMQGAQQILAPGTLLAGRPDPGPVRGPGEADQQLRPVRVVVVDEFGVLTTRVLSRKQGVFRLFFRSYGTNPSQRFGGLVLR